jgi:DNA repair protein RadC
MKKAKRKIKPKSKILYIATQVSLKTIVEDKVFLEKKISTPGDVLEIIRSYYDHDTMASKEEMIAIGVNSANKRLFVMKVSLGSSNKTVMDLKSVLLMMIKTNSIGLIISHNHPSGNMKPSKSDDTLTKIVKEGCKTIDCQLMDHIIMSPFRNQYYSYANEGRL